MRKRSKSDQAAEDGISGNTTTSLARGLSIIRAFNAEDNTLGNQELIERTGLPKATISRLSATLIALGYLRYDDTTGRYSIGPATISLGYSALSSSAVVHMARPLMQDLADQTGVAVALGMRENHDMVYLANARSMSPVTLRLNVGSRLPLWRTAMGLAYMAEMQPDARESIVEDLVQSDPQQEEKIRTLVADALRSLHDYGFVTSIGTWYSYINAVGLAFRPTDGSPLVALNCGGIVDIVPERKCLDEVGPALRQMVDQLRASLNGHSPQTPG